MAVTVIHKSENCAFLTNKRILTEKRNTTHRQSMNFPNPPHIIGRMSVVGEKEGKGPMGKYFDKVLADDKQGEKCFEQAEIRMLSDAVNGAILDAGIQIKDVDLLLAGDLLNQMTSSNYVARDLGLPFCGLYSACSTMTACLSMGAALISAGMYETVACATASHFATAERQYRYPLEYGCQRPPYAQWTVTGAGCSILAAGGEGPRVTTAVLGRVVDFGINDLNNMGAAMAPAAMDTMLALFKENHLTPDDFDLILTGDLGKLGSDILRDLMREQGYELGQRYMDCGNMMYTVDQHCYQGGSGAACSASIVNSFILDKMEKGDYNKIAYLATGALMSPQSCYQGETIPCTSHAVIIER